jgi:hypothetical protein
MKKIIIVQSIPDALELIRKKIGVTFPHLDSCVFYHSNFEKTLETIPKDEDIVVIASDSYHDEKDILFSRKEKDGSKLAEEIKKINPQAKVYIFSMYEPRSAYIDGFYQKSQMGNNTVNEMIDIFIDLGLDTQNKDTAAH